MSHKGILFLEVEIVTCCIEGSSKRFLPTAGLGTVWATLLSPGPASFSEGKKIPAVFPAPALPFWPQLFTTAPSSVPFVPCKSESKRTPSGARDTGQRADAGFPVCCEFWSRSSPYGHLQTRYLLKLSWWGEKLKQGRCPKGKTLGSQPCWASSFTCCPI